MAITAGAANDIALGRGGSYSLSRDVQAHRIWDTRVFDSGAISDFTYFTQQINAPWWGSTVKTKNETNMVSSGQMPVSQTFLIKRIGVALIAPLTENIDFAPAIAQAFINLIQSSVFEIRITGREFDFQVHGRDFLPSIALAASQAATIGAARYGDVIANGWVSLHDTPIFLDQQVQFNVTQLLNNPLPAIQTILKANSTWLYTYYCTMQVTLEGTLTRGK